jgi:hypothetical protein
MIENDITISTYQWALARATELRGDKLNSGQETVWWHLTHQRLTKHAPVAGESSECVGCAGVWPCTAVKGSVSDLRNGRLGC